MSRLHIHRSCALHTAESMRSISSSHHAWVYPGRFSSGPPPCRLCSVRARAALFSNTNAAAPAGHTPLAVPQLDSHNTSQYHAELAMEVKRLEETFSKTPGEVAVHDASVVGPAWSYESENVHRFEDYARATKTVQDVQETNRELSALLEELSSWDATTESVEPLSQPSTSGRKTARSSKTSARQQRTRPNFAKPATVSTETMPATSSRPAATPGVTRRKFLQPVALQKSPEASSSQSKVSSDGVAPAAPQFAQQRAGRYRRQSSIRQTTTDKTAAFADTMSSSDYELQSNMSNSLYKGMGDANLLSGEQEKGLSLKVKEFLAFEELEKTLTEKLGRPPQAQEMANAAKLDFATFKGRWDAGKAAKKRMIECNLRLVIAIAKKEAGNKLIDIGIDSLVAEGIQGLLKGVERFDHTKGFRFSTYAHWWIRQAVQRCIQLEASIVRLPEYVAGDDVKVHRALAAYREKYRKLPTDKELAKVTGISEARVKAVFEFKYRANVASLEAGSENDNDQREHVMAADTDDPFEDADNQQLRNDLEQMLNCLEAREAMVLKARYGLDADGQPRTLEEVGLLFNLTRERIRQIEMAALKKLRSHQAQALTEHTLDDLKVSGRRAGGLRKSS